MLKLELKKIRDPRKNLKIDVTSANLPLHFLTRKAAIQ